MIDGVDEELKSSKDLMYQTFDSFAEVVKDVEVATAGSCSA